PIGGYFVWDGSAATAPTGEPLFLVGGGSGVVPLMAMLRHRSRTGLRNPARLLLSARHAEDVIYRSELEALAAAGDGFQLVLTLPPSPRRGGPGSARRCDARMVAEVLEPLGSKAGCFVCGPTALVEVAANALARLGLPADRIRTERFGPTGT